MEWFYIIKSFILCNFLSNSGMFNKVHTQDTEQIITQVLHVVSLVVKRQPGDCMLLV